MPFLLSTYLATEMLAPFFASLVILNAVLFMGKLVPLLETIFDLQISIADFIRICAYLTPNLLLFSIPMASMMAVIISFTRLTNDNEILALKAGGVGLRQMVTPVIIFALCNAMLTGTASIILSPNGTVAMEKLLFQLAKEKIDKGMRENQFSESLGDVVLYIDRIDPETEHWQGVYVSDLRDPQNPVTIFASDGEMQPDLANLLLTLNLDSGTMHRSDGEITQTVQFQRYTLNLPIKPPKFMASQVGKSGMPQADLLQAAAKEGYDSNNGRQFLVEYHRRLILPVGCFILTILGLPLALRTRPGRRAIGLPLGLIGFLLYYVGITASKSIATGGAAPLIPTMWAPNLLFIVLAITLTKAAALEATEIFMDRLADKVATLGRLVPSFKGKERP